MRFWLEQLEIIKKFYIKYSAKKCMNIINSACTKTNNIFSYCHSEFISESDYQVIIDSETSSEWQKVADKLL
jgi:hypothetical protein